MQWITAHRCEISPSIKMRQNAKIENLGKVKKADSGLNFFHQEEEKKGLVTFDFAKNFIELLSGTKMNQIEKFDFKF